jgi:adenine-specific DNA-methyltransferase
LSESTLRERDNAPRADAPFRPFTRKYLGSKRLLREWIADRICAEAGVPRVFLDGFFGTGAVSFAMARRGVERITAVDTLRCNCAILRGFTAVSTRVPGLMQGLNALPPVSGYVTANYAGTYFTEENCRRMDATREEIARLAGSGEIGPAEHDILLASFLLSADRVANTLGQYDAFLKNIHGEGRSAGRHLVDERVRTPFQLRPLDGMWGARITVLEEDMVSAAPRLPADAAYYDPPYNGRQYCDNYHVLENLARWEKPPLFGKTLKFDRTGLRSPFSRRTAAAGALRQLVAGTRAPHVFLSYSSEGILSPEEIAAILGERGAVTVTEIPYPVFGNGAGVSSRRSIIEHLFHLATTFSGNRP